MATKKNIVTMASEDDIAKQIETLRADIALLAKTVKTEAKATVADKTATLVNTAQQKTEAAKAQYDELTTKAESSIRENPLTAVAIAVGAGLLLGAITRR